MTIMGLSKTFSITGWRLGLRGGAAPSWRAPIAIVNDLYYVCAPTPLQHGAAAGFAAPKLLRRAAHELPDEARHDLRGARRRAHAAGRARRRVLRAGGHLAHRASRVARDAAMALLERTKVASIAGHARSSRAPSASGSCASASPKRTTCSPKRARRIRANPL